MSNQAAQTPRIVNTAAAMMIGGELLSGKIRDENLYALCGTLRSLGIDLRKVVFCPDEIDTIAEELNSLREKFDVVFTSGGVGPTHDDLTVDGVAQALGVDLVVSDDMAEMLRGHYGEGITETHLRMARVPEGAQLTIRKGIWPTVVAGNVWILPGVPQLFKMKLQAIRDNLRGPHPFFTRDVFCSVEETDLKTELDQVVQRHPEVEVGSYPKLFDKRYKTRVTLDARDETQVEEALKSARELLSAYLVTLD